MAQQVAQPVTAEPMSEEQRAERLSEVVVQEQGRGADLVNRGRLEAVMQSGKPVNHVLHLLLSVLTLGLWLIVWLCLGLSGGERRYVLRVNEFGAVHRHRI